MPWRYAYRSGSTALLRTRPRGVGCAAGRKPILTNRRKPSHRLDAGVLGLERLAPKKARVTLGLRVGQFICALP